MKPKKNKSIRLLPGIIIALLLLLIRFLIPAIFPNYVEIGIMLGFLALPAIIIWWAFFSRVPIPERLIAIFTMIVALIISSALVDESIGTGMQGMMYFLLAPPFLCFAFVAWAVVSRQFKANIRYLTLILVIVISSGAWTLFRSNGITGEAGVDLVWRWSETIEEKFLEQSDLTYVLVDAPLSTEVEWPGFRGINRDSKVSGIQIATDWEKTPPVELWRKKIGPACSSFSVWGDLIFTQEQRGEEELVSCYSLKTGDPVWQHSDEARFWDSHAGAGPRGTPTIKNGRIYAMGATGILNVLDAINGKKIWSVNVADDTKTKIPGWGFASSPLIANNVVLVGVSGTIAAYNINSGKLLWYKSNEGECYTSPHQISINRVEQILMMSTLGATSFSPDNGKILWEYELEGSRIIQPAEISDGGLLIDAGEKKGLQRIKVSQQNNSWEVKELWKTNRMKPDFNDLVIHKGNVYGFDGPMLTCINLADGNKNWRGGRFSGEILLLEDQDLLIVLTEKGDIVLVEATPEKYTELAQIHVVNSKTWNHPALANNILLVRNSEEMVALKLSSK